MMSGYMAHENKSQVIPESERIDLSALPMTCRIEHDPAPREPFGDYRYRIYRDGILVARYWHDYRSDEHAIAFVDRPHLVHSVGRMVDVLDSGKDGRLQLNAQAQAWIEEHLARTTSSAIESAGRQSASKRRSIDELFLDVLSVRITMSAPSACDIVAQLDDGHDRRIVIQTTRKNRIVATTDTDDHALERTWYRIARTIDGSLALFEADACRMHLEQMHRGHYWLGLTALDAMTTDVHLHFTTSGRLKAGMIDSPQED